MANFPSSLDTTSTLPNPTGTSTQASPDHAALHTTENVAIIALESKLGIGASTPSGTNLLGSTGTGTSAWSYVAPTGTILGTTDTQNITNKAISSSTWSGGTIDNATVTVDSISGHTTAGSGTIYGLGVAAGAITTSGYASSTALQANAVQANQLATSAILLGYAQTTSTFSTSSSTYVQVTGLTTTVTIPAGGRKVKITVYFGATQNTNTGTGQFISIWDGTVGSGTQLQQLELDQEQATFQLGGMVIAVVTPSAGSKTYNVGVKTTAGGANFEAATTSPAFILVEAI